MGYTVHVKAIHTNVKKRKFHEWVRRMRRLAKRRQYRQFRKWGGTGVRDIR